MPVTIGVDPHKASHTAATLDEHGQLLDRQRVPATSDGYQALRAWAARWPQRCWAVEGAHGVGRVLAQQLVADGERVVDVPAKLAARVRVLSVGHGRKTDPDDAVSVSVSVSVAVAAQGAPGLRPVGVEDHAVVLHLLTNRREDLVRLHTQTINRLHRLLADLVPAGAGRNLTAERAEALLGEVRPTGAVATPRWQLAGDLIADIRDLDRRSCRSAILPPGRRTTAASAPRASPPRRRCGVEAAAVGRRLPVPAGRSTRPAAPGSGARQRRAADGWRTANERP